MPPLLLAMAVLANAQETDKDTLAGMDAEVSGDWIEAVKAFERALGAQPADTKRALRLRYARQRGIAIWKPQVEQMLKQKQLEDAACAVAIARAIDPDDATIQAAARELEKAGVKAPEPPADESVSPLFPGRSAAGRLRCRSKLGPPFGRASRLIDKGIAFLLSAQGEKGNWENKKYGGYEFYDVGVTGLALLALLVDGPGGLAGDRGAAARRAADYLAGPLEDGGNKEVYCKVFSIEGLAEYAAVAGETERLKAALERGRDSLVQAQNPGAGWQYEPRCGTSDTSVTARAVSALHRLRLAGITSPDESMRDAMAWIDSMVEPTCGQIGYNNPGGAPARLKERVDTFPTEHSQSMTSAGLLVTCYAGAQRAWLPTSLSLVAEVPPMRRYPDMYYWELGSRAQVAATGTVPTKWYAALVDAAAACVRSDGGMADCDAWQGEGGRIYATAMTVLALAAPFAEPGPKGATSRSASDFLRGGRADVVVAAATAETPTGIYLDAGMKVTAIARGTIQPWTGSPKVASDGIKAPPKSYKPLLKGAPFACLLGRIGPEGKPFRMQSEKPVAVTGHGQLCLLINDERPEDGDGAWDVRIRLE